MVENRCKHCNHRHIKAAEAGDMKWYGMHQAPLVKMGRTHDGYLRHPLHVCMPLLTVADAQKL